MSVEYNTSRGNRAFDRNTNQAELFFALRGGTIVKKKKKKMKKRKTKMMMMMMIMINRRIYSLSGNRTVTGTWYSPAQSVLTLVNIAL
jgi:hypothetical protein